MNFLENEKQTQLLVDKIYKKSNTISIIRFVLMIGIITFLLLGYFQKNTLFYIISFVYLFFFIAFVFVHDKVKKELSYNQALLEVYHEHVLRMNNQWDTFVEDGSSFVDEKDYTSLDLDVFAHHSLFQMINICFTYGGKKKLAQSLSNKDFSNVKNRQQATLELSQDSQFVVEMQTYGKMTHIKKESMIYDYLQSIKDNQYKPFFPYIMIFPIIAIVSIVLASLSIGYPYTYIVAEVVIVFQLFLSFFLSKTHGEIFEPIRVFDKSLRSYVSIFELIQKQNWNSRYLQNIHKQLFKDSDVLNGIKELSKIAQRVSYRNNLFAFLILNGLGLYEIYMRNQYIKWLNHYQDDIRIWFDCLAELEALMSLSVLKIDEFDVTLPTIVEKQSLQLSFQDLRHPLIDQQKVVGNSFKMNNSVCIITGSNMSGKTTFMRTVGLNLILAYAGGFVFGESMECSCMNILTSMRVKDNVEEGVSTFYGELLRIKTMIDFSNQQVPLICLIDEIFKGTNSLDRIAGAKATIEKLSQPHIFTFLTTHDVELCQSQVIEVQNHHFEEYYDNQKIYFDYLIKDGKSQTTNGQFLLRQLGIMK
ncbi:MAG: hypothetical protein RR630_01895 [Coprobacillus sp.]